MSKEIFYRQCNFYRFDEEGRKVTTTSWIPEVKDGVKIEKDLRVTLRPHGVKGKDYEGPLWTIKSVGNIIMPKEKALNNCRKWSIYRKQIDV